MIRTQHNYSVETHVPVMEEFLTIQGEGNNTGQAAYFIRLAGCDVGCTWCDVKESWVAEKRQWAPIDDLVAAVVKSGCPNVVITGGEPCMYDLTSLTTALKREGVNLWLETSGAHSITGTWDWIVFSPKKFKRPLAEAYSKAHELKVVVANKHDFKWAESHAELVSSTCCNYLQPEWSRAAKLTPLIVDYVKSNPQWRVSLQTHKFMNIP